MEATTLNSENGDAASATPGDLNVHRHEKSRKGKFRDNPQE